MPRIPHDELFRHTFEQPEHAAALFRLVLPPTIVAAIDWSTLEPCDGTFVSGRLSKHYTDLLFKVRLGNHIAYIHLVLEHKSRNGRGTVLQMQGYVTRIQKRHWREQRGRRNRRLPLVLPIVVHHGTRPWTSPTELGALLDLDGVPEELHDVLCRYQPQFRYFVLSTAGCTATELRGLALTVLGKVTLGALQLLPGVLPDRAVPTIVEWLDLFHEILRAPSGKESLDALLSYLIRATPLEPERLLEVLWQKADKEIHMRFKSTALQLHERGKVEGKAEGKVEGKAEGLTEGRSAILIDLLTTRFGTIPHPLTSRIRAATPDQLQSWARRCLDAASIDDVFAVG